MTGLPYLKSHIVQFKSVPGLGYFYLHRKRYSSYSILPKTSLKRKLHEERSPVPLSWFRARQQGKLTLLCWSCNGTALWRKYILPDSTGKTGDPSNDAPQPYKISLRVNLRIRAIPKIHLHRSEAFGSVVVYPATRKGPEWIHAHHISDG